jgi:hypothetical protein
MGYTFLAVPSAVNEVSNKLINNTRFAIAQTFLKSNTFSIGNN